MLLKWQDKRSSSSSDQLSDSQIADNIIGVIFAAHDTTASVLTWVLKYLHDNEELLKHVMVIFSTSLEFDFIIHVIYINIYFTLSFDFF